MKEQSYWESYKVFANQLALELPDVVAPFGEFVVKWSPFIMILVVVTKLIDLLFKSDSTKFIANGLIRLCRSVWKEAHKEPEHKGLITEASIKVQKVFHQTSAVAHGFLGLISVLYSLLVLAALFFMDIKEELVIEGSLVLLALSFTGIFLGFIQFGICHQAIKLSKSLPSN
ncbi:TPA: hypothetical protein I7171_22275 [Vibrio vulnificus]|uniref:hypothetical protein n=3 Tax=Vibrio vulnificus TaxID=672 RepID=UPI0005F18D29|nr:hypothetical protein [Vibrio vulnificus]HAS6199497.1 hypothetical protein [Vibrio vulnificus]HAT7741528.1 hypothetical protein [Vibrio vulnificus]HDY7736112.1 hypothetical protein [Vibrio vulnificus]